MSRVQAVVCETHVGQDEHKTVVMAYESSTAMDVVSNITDYNDVVTQEDIDFLHAHAAKHFGTPKFVKSSEAAW
ncbi:hypothetical protein V6R98_02265 [Agrobacterium sp. CCNWLW71]|uniref:hypothetical protein n=1 Tax=unclassified Agrobacterium TaxID=2632611 RepID=UPI002FF270DD